MKTSILYLVMGLLVINTLSAQVKIGENPQNLDPSSILELQSTNRVLVITRVSDAQMNDINPLPGAVVYNTDQDCLHYYNGTEWINICEELDNSFTTSTRADSLQQINPNARDNTIAILESTNPDGSTNYNFEVNRITGANIVDTSINGDSKLQDETVTNRKLAEDAVALKNLADATNAGDIYMYNGSAWNFVNRSDLLNTQLDSIVGNEVTNATLNGSLERFGLGTATDPYTLDVADGGIDTEELADDAVTNEKLNANVAGTGLAQAADGSLEVEMATLSGDGTLISTNSTIAITGTPTNALFENVQIDVADNSIRSNMIIDGQVSTQDIADGVVTNIKMANNSVGTDQITNDAVTSVKILDDNVTLAKLANGTATGQLMQWDGTNWGLVDETALNITEVDGDPENELSDLSLTGTLLELTNAETGAVGVDLDNTFATDAQLTALNTDDADADPENELSDLSLTGTLLELTNAETGAVGVDLNNNITSAMITDGTITNDDINGSAAIDGSKINPVFTNNVTTTGDFISGGQTLMVPDYVFQKYYTGYSGLKNTYSFRSLQYIEKFVQKYNHLPGVKSASEIKSTGKYNLTISSLKHLEKIEELFLHTIEQEKKIETLKSNNQKLAEELDSLKAEMQEIKAILLEKAQN